MSTHHTLIGGTAYAVSGGSALINGTKYQIGGGTTLIDGTKKSIQFVRAVTVTVTRNYTDGGPPRSSFVTYNGTAYSAGSSFTANAGEQITVKVGDENSSGTYYSGCKITLNGVAVTPNLSGQYTLTLTGDTSIVFSKYSTGMYQLISAAITMN